MDRQRERYDQLTEPERLALSRAQSLDDLPLIAQYGEARQRRNEELAASGIGQDAESMALADDHADARTGDDDGLLHRPRR